MHLAEIELYELLKEKVGEREAKSLVEYIETRVERKFQEHKDLFATKEEIVQLFSTHREEVMKAISALREEFMKALSGQREDFTKALSGQREEFTREMAALKTDLIKWMFIFWTGQALVIFTLLKIFFSR